MDGHISDNTLNVYSETLFKIAEKLKSLSDTEDLKQLKELNNEIAETLPILKEIDDIGTELTKPIIDELKTNLETLMSDIQNKLDSDFFKGATGEPFTYDKFTPQQIENLKIKGDEGKPFTYDMFTDQQLENLKVHGNDGKDAIRDMRDTISITKNLDFLDGVKTEIINKDDFLPYGNYISTITLQTAGKGGKIYSATLFFLFSYSIQTNNLIVYPLNFNAHAHAFNGSSFGLYSSLNDSKTKSSLLLSINGESSTDVPVTIKLKEVLI